MTAHARPTSTGASTGSSSDDSVYERLGGADAIRAVVESFYESVLSDPELAPFFEGVDLAWLIGSQSRFFAAALGGPAEYTGRSMRAVHARMQITPHVFDLTAGHLVAALATAGVAEELIAEVVSAVAPLADEIVTLQDSQETEPMSPSPSTTTDALDAAALHSMLENMPVNVICADRDCRITYMNQTSYRTLSKLAHLLPVPIDRVVGTSIDAFHKNPAHQRAILANPSNLPHQATIDLSGEKLSLLATAVLDERGNYVGPMVTWDVITDKLRQERELQETRERERTASEALQQKVDSMLRVVLAAAGGDLTQSVPVSGADAIGKMGEGLGQLLRSLRDSLQRIAGNATTLASASEELTATAQQMNASSEETSAQAAVVSDTSHQVSAHVQTVAAGTGELNASIKEIARNAATAAQIANEAVRVVQETNETISKLSDSSQEIGQVTKVITSIAQQTNLLALNATIEAARAGDAGKGFAVVANEVKELAKETAKATEDISTKIEAIQADTRDSIVAIERIGTIIAQINDAQGTIAGAVEEQSATTSEMARSVSEANDGTQEIVQNIGGVAQAAQDTARGSAGVETAASELSKMANELQGLVAKFRL